MKIHTDIMIWDMSRMITPTNFLQYKILTWEIENRNQRVWETSLSIYLLIVLHAVIFYNNESYSGHPMQIFALLANLIPYSL